MTTDESPPKPQSTAHAAAAAASGASLAPGFRFHPTDEELVSYYLKRKVLSKPFAVDAISDVDLYKVEPWDLPGKSRIQSRDMEWYFFASLDKKYSNRSKTNRATGQGYWKTTGKDRAVRRGARVVGMKKTLVFHIGRAPKGERTNWVMHEYRLEDEELEKAGVPQDASVVCRIFQKNGPGPQNGAQYGALFLEAEWEDDEKVMVGFGTADGDVLLDDGNRELSELEGQNMDVQNENTAYQVGSSNGEDIVLSSVEPNSFPLQTPQNEVTNDLNEVIYLPEFDGNMALVPSGSIGMLGSAQSSPLDDYLELNDFFEPLDAEEFGLQIPQMMQNEQTITRQIESDDKMGVPLDIEEFFITVEDDILVPKQEAPPLAMDSFYSDEDAVFNTNAGGERDVNMSYFDATSIDPGVECGFVEMTDFLDPMYSGASVPDPLEDLVAYFDATEDFKQNPPMDYSEFLDFSQNNWEEDDDVKPGTLSTPNHSGTNESAASGSGQRSFDALESPESPGVEYAADKSIKGRLISMLGSISSPPALAAEPKSHGLNPTAQTSSSFHITAGMIHINGLGMNGSAHPWFNQKNEDVGFVLSYDSTRADVRSTSSGLAPVGKMHCSCVSVAVRSGYCLSFLSVLVLALVVKVGVIYAR